MVLVASLYGCCCHCYFEVGSHCVVQTGRVAEAGLTLMLIFLFLPPEYWHYRHAPPALSPLAASYRQAAATMLRGLQDLLFQTVQASESPGSTLGTVSSACHPPRLCRPAVERVMSVHLPRVSVRK